STVLLGITGVMLATVFALTAARASRRFAYHGGMRSTNLRHRIRLSNLPARVSPAARSKARGTGVPASGEALSARDSAPLVASTLLHVRSVAREDWASALTRLRRAVVEACRGAARLLSHARRRRSFPSIAWYATSGLLAFAVGAWVAIYLK